jgi:hypothetical protein
MADWTEWAREIRRQVDASNGSGVTLTIEEIRASSGFDWLSIDRQWWWELTCDPDVVGKDVKLSDFGLHCQPRIENDRVTAVTFTRRQ